MFMQVDAIRFMLIVFSKFALELFFRTFRNQVPRRMITGSIITRNNRKAIVLFNFRK
jgi:hypothetical protein